MTFKSHDGLIESRTFSDFWQHCAKNPLQMKCPVCGSQCYRSQSWLGFNMDMVGKITFKCTKPGCEFNDMDFTVEATSREVNKWTGRHS